MKSFEEFGHTDQYRKSRELLIVTRMLNGMITTLTEYVKNLSSIFENIIEVMEEVSKNSSY